LRKRECLRGFAASSALTVLRDRIQVLLTARRYRVTPSGGTELDRLPVLAFCGSCPLQVRMRGCGAHYSIFLVGRNAFVSKGVPGSSVKHVGAAVSRT